jgi:hypothetical protein
MSKTVMLIHGAWLTPAGWEKFCGHYQGAFGIGTGIQSKNPKRPPLLLVCGEKDITITPATVRAAFKK